MQREDTEIQTAQLGIFQYFSEFTAGGFGIAVKTRDRRIRNHKSHDRHRQQGQHTCQREDAWNAQHPVEHRGQDQRNRKGDTDGHAYHRHRLGSMLFAGQIGGQRHHRRVDRPCALYRTTGNHPIDIVRRGGDKTAQREDHQARVNNRLASVTVGHPTRRNLQHRLRQTVSAERNPHQQMTFTARQLGRIQGENRQDDKQPQHTQAIDTRQAKTGAAFGVSHHIGRSLHNSLLQ